MNEETKIIHALSYRRTRGEIYEAAMSASLDIGSGQYFITYRGGGPFKKVTVLGMVERGVLKRKYEEGECYVLA